MDFLPEEFAKRCARIQALMHKAEMDALFLCTEAEIRYFTGFRTLFWLSPTRPWYVIIPQKGKPIALIPEIGVDLMQRTWLESEDIHSWSSPAENDDGISALIKLLSAYKHIGIAMGRESMLRMPLADFTKLKEGLLSHSFINATPLIDAVRHIKSETEIKVITKICTIASQSFANAPTLFSEGMAMQDIFRAFKISLLQNGAEDVPYLVGGLDEGGYSDVISPPSQRPARSGDILMLDTGATLKGYFCDFDRNFAFGHASDEAQYAYDKLYKATDIAVKAMRVGATCKDIYTLLGKALDATTSNVGRFGHGLGIQLTETPSIIHFDDTPLQAGMVMTIEPSLPLRDGKMMVHEENILITEDEAVLLTKRAPSELPVIK